MSTKIASEKKSIRQKVREAYAARVENGGCGCGCGREADTPATEAHSTAALRMGYSADDVESVPEGANLGLGCGAPLQHGQPKEGETILDLGSGAGFDAFLSARMVGAEGRVIGVDMTPEMIARARENASKSGIENVEFRQGLIEELPVESDTVDLVISNCVINLSPDKQAVFNETFRVLRPGGRIAVSDIVLTQQLPKSIADNLAAYVGCVAGASLLDDYLAMLSNAGFEQVEVVESRPAVDALSEDDAVVKSVLEDFDARNLDDLSPLMKNIAGIVRSAKVTARKPAAAS
jgi:SAM-dependent methyltransferase